MPLSQEITFTLNGSPKTLRVPVNMSALAMIRDMTGLTGTKYGCGEGECGACTIIADGDSICSCLMFAVDCDGRDITTIEALHGDEEGQKILDAFSEYGAVQCGFCSPGFVVQAKNLVDKNPHANREAIKRGIEGNICRCTGYVKIIDAIAAVTVAND